MSTVAARHAAAPAIAVFLIQHGFGPIPEE